MDTAVDILLLLALMAACAGGMILAVFQLPGTWLIVVAALCYAWYYDWARIGANIVITAGVIAAVAEAIETLGGMMIAKRGGASRRAGWYGLVGGLAGAILLSVPVPIIGTIIGAAIGCFVGALIAELQLGRGLNAGTRSGVYSAVGRVIGSMLKVFASVVLAGLVIVSAIVAWGA